MTMAKKITGIMIAVAIIALSAISVFAATPAVESEVLSHNFSAYQIFSAERVDDNHVTNVEWGSMFGRSTVISSFLADIKGSNDFVDNGKNVFADCTTADDVARVLTDYQDYSDIAKAFADHASSYANIPFSANGKTEFKNGDTLGQAGYYLFEDVSSSTAVVNPIILKMAADSKVEIEVKASVPQVEKKVKENTYNNNYNSETIYVQEGNAVIPFTYANGYNDAADYNIGDLVPFELIGTIPDNFDEYSKFYYSFEDTLSKGLTFDESVADLHVYLYDVNGGKYTNKADVTSYFTVYASKQRTGETYLSVTCNDILGINPALTYSSVLAVEYNAVLNENATIGLDGNINEVYLEYSNNPKTPNSHGQTPVDTTIVFTYKVEGNKYDAAHEKKLEGAGFTLKSVETGKYYSSKVTPHWVDREADAEVVYSDKNGVFGFVGLDKGVYELNETEAPNGYKVIDEPIYIKISAKILPDISDDAAQHWNGEPSQALVSLDCDVALDNNFRNEHPNVYDFGVIDTRAGVKLDVLNTSVYDLPGTGGMGTTLFYIAGGVLLAAAVVLIIVKRRAR